MNWIEPELVRVSVRHIYADTDLEFVGPPEEVLTHLMLVFNHLRLESPTVLALEHLVEIIDAEQCLSAEIAILTRSGS
jgi:hypothetical protein